MSGNDPIAACDRLVRFFERALALEPRDRLATDDSIRVPVITFAIAQLRMRVRPAFAPGWVENDPVHVVLFGGTNTGKSTVLNLLLGRDAAVMGVRARLSQHPEGYRPIALGDDWLSGAATRFVGYGRYRDEHPPRQTDDELRRDGYRPAFAVLDPDRIPGPALAPAATAAVVWDGPDYSTEAAGAYLGTVIDLLALADLVVMTLTDESYADDRGNALLRMVGESGMAVHVIANKLPENPSLLDDVTRTLDAAGRSRAPIHRLPEVAGGSPAARLERLLATAEAVALRGAIARETARGRALKTQALLGSLAFLERHFDEVVRPLAIEAGAAAGWALAVERLARERILEPHRRDYLEGVRYGEFNRTLIHLMELLQVPWIGPFLELTRRLVRLPLRLAGEGIRRLLGKGAREPRRPPEEEVLRLAIESWLVALKAEAQGLADGGTHGTWAEIAARLDDPRFREALLSRFDEAFAAYREQIDGSVRRRAESLYETLKENPRRLNTLRGANLLAGAASVVIAVKSAGLDWSDAVIGPVVAGLWQNLVEWGLGRYLETLRDDLVREQARAIQATVAAALEQPVRDLFQGAVSARELVAARDDLHLVTAEATRIAEGNP